jgi:hypothetical protein
VIYPVDERRPDTAGLAPAFAAARARLGLVALLFILAVSAWWYTLDRTRGMDSDQGMRDDPQRTHPRPERGRLGTGSQQPRHRLDSQPPALSPDVKPDST